MQGFDKTSSVAQIISDLALNSTQPVMAQVGAIWDSYAYRAVVSPELQGLYTRKQICWNLLGGIWPAVDYTQAGVDEKLGEFTTHLQGLHDNYLTEINKFEMIAAKRRTPQVGAITKTAAVMPTVVGAPDPNCPVFGGDPRYPGGFNRPPF